MDAITPSILQEKIEEEDYPCYRLKYYYQGATRGESVVHQRTCKKCIEWLFENDRARFDFLLRGSLNATLKSSRIIPFAANKGYDLYLEETSQECDLLKQIFLSCKPYKIPQETINLPDYPGVYLVAINNQNSTKVAYVGSSMSMRRRLANHHLNYEFEILIQAGVEMSVYCLLFPVNGTEEAMRETEMHLIRELKPKLNSRLGN